jgi:hypothetical protein
MVTAWTTSAAGILSISSSGVATGVSLGTANLAATAAGLTSPNLALTVVSAKTLTGVTLGNTGSVTSITVGGTLQFHAYCAYAGAATQDCSVTDIYGDTVTAWGSSATGVLSLGAVSGSHPGLATGVAAGTANATAIVNGSVNATPYAVTVTTPSPTLTGITLSATGGVTGLLVSHTNQLLATCTYSDGSTTSCNTTDVHGNVAGTWTSTSTAHATVSTSGLATGVAAGTTTFTANAGTFTSPALPLTILAVPSGIYSITINGPVKFSGRVSF